MTEPVKRMFVRDVAAYLERSVSAARATMVRLEREHGTAVVRREGQRMYTDRRALDAVLSGRPAPIDLDRVVATLVANGRADRHQMRALAAAYNKLRDEVRELKAGHKALCDQVVDGLAAPVQSAKGPGAHGIAGDRIAC